MRIVLDTNVLVSGLISAGGPPGRLIDGWLDAQFDLVTSEAQLSELRRVLGYGRIAERLSAPRVDVLLRNMRIATIVEPVVGVDLSPDPDDNLIIATAIAWDAGVIVSGDKSDLLSLGAAEAIEIIDARAALRILPGERSG